MDKALRYELDTIPEITNKVYPTNAPEGKKTPYLVYFKSNYRQLKTLEGVKNQIEANYLLNILSSSYVHLDDITQKVKSKLLTFPLRQIGVGSIYIQDMTIDNIAETYEDELKLYRCIIDVKFSYKE